LLPAGPLREGLWRLRRVDAVVVNGGKLLSGAFTQFSMSLQGAQFINLRSGEARPAAAFHGLKLHAVAGIGHPQRFFDHLHRMGLEFAAHEFPDHHAFCQEDLNWPCTDALLMTEKDAVKCAAFADERYWVLPVEARLDAAFGIEILELLRKCNGRKVA
jgi:tetraacyldisaccharide 4'-kinase